MTTRHVDVQNVHVEVSESDEAATPAREAVAVTSSTESSAVRDGTPVVLRQGLPRTAGAAAWPIEAEVISRFAPTIAPGAASPTTAPATPDTASQQAEPLTPDASRPTAVAAAEEAGSRDAIDLAPARAPAPAPAPTPAHVPPTVVDESAPRDASARSDASAPRASRAPRPPLSRRAKTALGVVAVFVAAALAIFVARWLVGLDWVADFMRQYPGESHLPENAPVGFPAWLGWQHAFNAFLMVLIIRSGLRVRGEGRPSHYWTPRWNPTRKISLWKWFHQSLDLLWMVNGTAFIVLLLVTGQWMRVVPTSWDVIPNALSAGLQYLSLDWPTDNGWVNYNGLQLLAYFTTIFIAAPLAALSGFRMSGLWPEKAKRLSRIVSIGFARAIHFPVMLYFVAFITIHVCLVFSTGALRNLNHMFAMQGSADPTIFEGNWVGLWIFVALVVAIAAAWFAARPLVLSAIAGLFGRVSNR